MSLIEGGDFACYCGFRTASIQDYNEHCSQREGDTTHVSEKGTTRCTNCGDWIKFENLPFQPFKPDGSKSIALTCDECEQLTVGKVKITKKISAKDTDGFAVSALKREVKTGKEKEPPAAAAAERRR